MRDVRKEHYDKVSFNRLSDYIKIGYYDKEANTFICAASFRNAVSKSGCNYGLLRVIDDYDNFISFSRQKGYNSAGGYNKSIANFEQCLRDFKEVHSDFSCSDCGSITSYTRELKDYLQKSYTEKLFVLVCI